MAKGGQPQKNATSPQLKLAAKLLDDGDVVSARREANKVLAAPASPEDAAEATALLTRVQTPKEIYLLVAAVAAVYLLLVVLAVARS